MRIFDLSRFIVALMATALCLTGCATPISPLQIANADYGPPPPKNYQAQIKTSFSRLLIDPTAPIYEFGTPSKGYFKSAPIMGTYEMFGWRVCGTVNSKNRLGGYAGSVPFIVLFRDGKVAQQVLGEPADSHNGLSLVNPAITSACQR